MCRDPEIERRAEARALLTSNIPPNLVDKDFETYRLAPEADLEAADWVEEWTRVSLTPGFHGSLLLLGEIGTRKTGLGVSAFRQLTRSSKFRPAVFITPVDLFRQLTQAIKIEKKGGEPTQSEGDQIDYLCRVPLLMLDDVCAERWTEYREEKLYEIIGARYNRQLVTIFTSNRGLTQLERFLGPRVKSRVIEMCAGNTIDMGMEDKRVVKAMQGVV